MQSELKCSVLSLPVRYLGIPLGANPKRVETWQPIISKIKKKLSGWKINVLSKAGKLTLIKSVLNNLLIYYLGLFKLPKTVAKEIISIQRRFFWSNKERGKFSPLVNWEVVQMPKNLGGLGVGDVLMKNAALLFKWWWRFSTENSMLWKQVIC